MKTYKLEDLKNAIKKAEENLGATKDSRIYVDEHRNTCIATGGGTACINLNNGKDGEFFVV